MTRFTIDVGRDEVVVVVQERVGDAFENRMGWTQPRSDWPDAVLALVRGPA